jgi:hypothetical protein
VPTTTPRSRRIADVDEADFIGYVSLSLWLVAFAVMLIRRHGL